MSRPNRPITAIDLLDIRDDRALSVAEMCAFLEMTAGKFNKLTRRDDAGNYPTEPLDPALAGLVRLLNDDPDRYEIPRRLTPLEFISLLEKHGKHLTLKELAVMFGRDVTAAHRWMKKGSDAGPQIRAAMRVLHDIIEKEGNTSVIDDWNACIEAEAKSRGFDRLPEKGSWKVSNDNEQE